MTPEEADALRKRIALLKQIGEKIRAQSARLRDPSLESAAKYKREGWLGEVAALVNEKFEGNDAFVARASQLTINNKKPASETVKRVRNVSDPVANALDLLDTVEEFIFVDSPSAASEPLKNLIEQTLKERYFKSWEFRGLAAMFGLVTACFLGGTVYLGVQAQGVQVQADIAKRSIEAERASVDATIEKVLDEIKDKAMAEASAQIIKLNVAIAASADSIVVVDQKLRDNRNQIDQLIKDEKAAIDSAIAQASADAKSYLESKRPAIEASINAMVTERVQDASRQIQDKIELVNIRKQNFEDTLPEVSKYTDTRTKEFNDIVNRYSANIGEILSRFSGGDKLPAIQAVSRVLGFAFWLTLVASCLSALALGVSMWALFRARRPARERLSAEG